MHLGALAGLVTALAVLVSVAGLSVVARPQVAEAAIGAVCPVPTGEVPNGIKACTDRGDGATYMAGDHITVCVSANIPQIAIFPPPPPPTIRVENVAADGAARLLIDARMASGQQCVAGTVIAPFGEETVRAQALGSDGRVFQEDSVRFTTVAR
ncbi:MAG: hypothetical protein IT306_21795 [Chloroflexi bacterium]|nr:hypothetical protein [Chloroflexota bacterium]